jgi:hypothetical protein
MHRAELRADGGAQCGVDRRIGLSLLPVVARLLFAAHFFHHLN